MKFVFMISLAAIAGVSSLSAQAPLPLAEYHAKMLCSCLFVMEQEEEFCSEYVFLGFPVQEQRIDYNESLVEAKAFGASARAAFQGEQTGCLLE